MTERHRIICIRFDVIIIFLDKWTKRHIIIVIETVIIVSRIISIKNIIQRFCVRKCVQSVKIDTWTIRFVSCVNVQNATVLDCSSSFPILRHSIIDTVFWGIPCHTTSKHPNIFSSSVADWCLYIFFRLPIVSIIVMLQSIQLIIRENKSLILVHRRFWIFQRISSPKVKTFGSCDKFRNKIVITIEIAYILRRIKLRVATIVEWFHYYVYSICIFCIFTIRHIKIFHSRNVLRS